MIFKVREQSKITHAHGALFLDKQPLINAVHMKVMVARLYQFDNVLHLNLVVTDDTQFAGVLLALRHLRGFKLALRLELVLPWSEIVDLIVLGLVELRSLDTSGLLEVLIMQIGRVTTVFFLEVF